MAFGNSNPKYGDKGSRYNWELGVINLLSKILTALGGSPIVQTETITTTTSTGVGATTAGIKGYSITNTGIAAGTVEGDALPIGCSINVTPSDFTNILASVDYDATGTTFLIVELV
jgi:hypothetical protein